VDFKSPESQYNLSENATRSATDGPKVDEAMSG
jgi:hypothetical protein